jgi:hypothetical protein
VDKRSVPVQLRPWLRGDEAQQKAVLLRIFKNLQVYGVRIIYPGGDPTPGPLERVSS